MGFGTVFKANKAFRAQKNGNEQEAMQLYAECFEEGLTDARYVLSYAVLLIRSGQYQKAKDFLVKHQKAPGMTPDQRTTLIVDYCACCYRLGDLDKAVRKLEELYRKGPSGLIYQTLGYLYVEQYDAGKKAAFLARETEAQEQKQRDGDERKHAADRLESLASRFHARLLRTARRADPRARSRTRRHRR